MLFFRRLYTIAFYFIFNMAIFFLAKFLFDYIEPFASHAGANLYIENHVFTFVGLFFMVFHFNKENQIKEEELDRRNAQNELLLKEIHHRVKNKLQILSSLLSLQSDSEQNEKVLGALQEGRNRVESMGLIINELITNSIKYAKPLNQEVKIDVKLWLSHMSELSLLVSDNGTGSNESVEDAKSTNFGSQLITILSKKLKGEIKVDQSMGYSTHIVFKRFKLSPQSAVTTRTN